MMAGDRLRELVNTWFLLELIRGLMVTARHLVMRKVTVQYPEEGVSRFRCNGMAEKCRLHYSASSVPVRTSSALE